jgi:hypothetical protein
LAVGRSILLRPNPINVCTGKGTIGLNGKAAVSILKDTDRIFTLKDRYFLGFNLNPDRALQTPGDFLALNRHADLLYGITHI